MTMVKTTELPSKTTNKAPDGKQQFCEFEWLLRFLYKSLQASENPNFREASLQDSRLEELLARTAEYQVRLKASATHFLGRSMVTRKEETRNAAFRQ
jgi:hypothetical protein